MISTDTVKNSRALRRLAADHAALHNDALPPNYLFSPNAADNDDLTHLDILLAGPTHTPFSAGVFKLHLTIPPTYPQQPPTAHFRTPIFHPNVDPQTGGVCVETLKRDWDGKLTLRDILVVISCLLIQPNPDSALNAEAGSLIQDEYDAFKRRAELMTSIHAVVPKALKEDVREAQSRGQVVDELEAVEDRVEIKDFASESVARQPRGRRGVTARQRGTVTARRGDASPSEAGRRRPQPPPSQPFVMQTGNDDVFGGVVTPPRRSARAKSMSSSSSMNEVNQENDETRSPVKARTPKAGTPRRPPGAPVPLGELTLEEASSESDEEMEAEYPPSPRKSPSKSPKKQRPQLGDRPESSRDALRRAPNITPPSNIFAKPLAEDSPFAPFADPSPSPRKDRLQRPMTPGKPASKPGGLFGISTPNGGGGVMKAKSPSSAEKKRAEEEKREKLWALCGGDVRRWNRGDFDEQPFPVKAARW